MPKDAVTTPRFSTDHMENLFDSDPDRNRAFKALGSLQVNTSIGLEVQEELKRRGHILSTTPNAIAAPVMLYIDQSSNVIYSAEDPKAGRHAAALN